jgi:hypothetical protein
MTNNSSRRKIVDKKVNLDSVAEYSLLSPNGIVLNERVDEFSYYSRSTSLRNGEIFNVGGGSPYETETEFQLDFGGYVLTPKNDFNAWVSMWGAGGGGTDSSNSCRAGGGGFTRGLIQFKANIPYTIVIGEGGMSVNRSTFGGGGRGHHGGTGGDGGGLSGLFMDTQHNSRAAWAHNVNTPVKREQAILIAGGGGGKGHHVQSHHGNGGGGGGWVGRSSHNTTGGSQWQGGRPGYNNSTVNGGGHGFHGGHSGSNTSWIGGGGGGWYGGGGGGHTGTHHNGGAGGSGHHALPSEVAALPNNDKFEYIITAHTQTSAGHHNYGTQRPANWRNPLGHNTARGGTHVGRGAAGNNTSEGSRNGKVVIQLAPGYYDNHKKFKDINVSSSDWSHSMPSNRAQFNADRGVD